MHLKLIAYIFVFIILSFSVFAAFENSSLSYSIDDGKINGTILEDDSGNGNNGTISGATQSLDVFKVGDGSMCLDGTDDRVTPPNFCTAKPCTMAAWFKINSTASSGTNALFGRDGSLQATYDGAASVIKVRLFSSTWATLDTALNNSAAEDWNSVVYVWETNGTLAIYLNNNTVVRGAGKSTIAAGSGGLLMGELSTNPAFDAADFHGYMDQVMVDNGVAWNQTDASNYWDGGNGRDPHGPTESANITIISPADFNFTTDQTPTYTIQCAGSFDSYTGEMTINGTLSGTSLCVNNTNCGVTSNVTIPIFTAYEQSIFLTCTNSSTSAISENRSLYVYNSTGGGNETELISCINFVGVGCDVEFTDSCAAVIVP